MPDDVGLRVLMFFVSYFVVIAVLANVGGAAVAWWLRKHGHIK